MYLSVINKDERKLQEANPPEDLKKQQNLLDLLGPLVVLAQLEQLQYTDK